ncbi:MAG: preprotein translocase subunit YajC [Campylobacterales bacterium]
MEFLYGAEQVSQQPSLLASILPLLILFVIFYFLVILPQQRQMKKHREMVESLKKGDKILTQGGLYGEVVQNNREFLMVRIGKGVEVKLDKSAVARKLTDEEAS